MSAFRRFLNSSEKNTTSKSRDRSVWRQHITEQNTNSETWYRYPWQFISGRGRHIGGFILPEVKAFFRENKVRCIQTVLFFLDPSSWKLETARQTSSDQGRISYQTVETSCFRRQGWTTKKGNISFCWLWPRFTIQRALFFRFKNTRCQQRCREAWETTVWQLYMNPTYCEEKLIGL